MYNLHFIPNNIFTNFFKELTKYKNDYHQYLNFIYRNCRVTNCSPRLDGNRKWAQQAQYNKFVREWVKELG